MKNIVYANGSQLVVPGPLGGLKQDLQGFKM